MDVVFPECFLRIPQRYRLLFFYISLNSIDLYIANSCFKNGGSFSFSGYFWMPYRSRVIYTTIMINDIKTVNMVLYYRKLFDSFLCQSNANED